MCNNVIVFEFLCAKMTNEVIPNLAIERQERIRARLQEQHVVRVEELAAWLQVSTATVRRDLLALEQQGRLRRVHGGAVGVGDTLDEPLFDDKTAIAAAEKQAIAEAAAKLVHPTDTVFLDGGSTVLALARLLLPMPQLTVVTNSLRVAHLFSGQGPRMILVGGECRRISQTFVGPLSGPVLERVQLDLACMGTIGVSAADGLTTTDPNEAFTKELVMRRAHRVALLADSSKFGKPSFVRFGEAAQISVLITDAAAPTAELDAFRQAGVEVLVTP
ncbi:MAG: DeoR/GlpR family DNA-binding transcription regulator [Kiritimatiellae bacterium]|nr:DeoR/GlpR family DNA-binding transcription regulator [Kiritimatiellia bacterium]